MREGYGVNPDTYKGEVSANVTLIEASNAVEKKINEVIKLKQKWEKLYHDDYQRTRPDSKRAKIIEGEMDHIESRVKGTMAEIREISADIHECTELLSNFEVRRTFELWRPEEDYAVRKCKELLLKYTVR